MTSRWSPRWGTTCAGRPTGRAARSAAVLLLLLSLSFPLGLAGAIAPAAPAGPIPAQAPPVEEDYVLHCSACHGPAGAGVPDRVPALFETGEILLRPGGRDYLMRVPGAAQAPISDARLARLLGWVVERFGGVASEPAFTAAEVGAARRAPLRDPAAVRAKVMGARSAATISDPALEPAPTHLRVAERISTAASSSAPQPRTPTRPR